MRRLVAGRGAAVDDAAVRWGGGEEIGREAGGFVLQDEGAGEVGGGFGDVVGGVDGEEVGDVGVGVDSFCGGGEGGEQGDGG